MALNAGTSPGQSVGGVIVHTPWESVQVGSQRNMISSGMEWMMQMSKFSQQPGRDIFIMFVTTLYSLCECVQTRIETQDCAVQCSLLLVPPLNFLHNFLQHSVDFDINKCLTDSSESETLSESEKPCLHQKPQQKALKVNISRGNPITIIYLCTTNML